MPSTEKLNFEISDYGKDIAIFHFVVWWYIYFSFYSYLVDNEIHGSPTDIKNISINTISKSFISLKILSYKLYLALKDKFFPFTIITVKTNWSNI